MVVVGFAGGVAGWRVQFGAGPNGGGRENSV
jgi:hypothetical protein